MDLWCPNLSLWTGRRRLCKETEEDLSTNFGHSCFLLKPWKYLSSLIKMISRLSKGISVNVCSRCVYCYLIYGKNGTEIHLCYCAWSKCKVRLKLIPFEVVNGKYSVLRRGLTCIFNHFYPTFRPADNSFWTSTWKLRRNQGKMRHPPHTPTPTHTPKKQKRRAM